MIKLNPWTHVIITRTVSHLAYSPISARTVGGRSCREIHNRWSLLHTLERRGWFCDRHRDHAYRRWLTSGRFQQQEA